MFTSRCPVLFPILNSTASKQPTNLVTKERTFFHEGNYHATNLEGPRYETSAKRLRVMGNNAI